uniref:Uncharacterized protein n=1 Tax=Arundo donax TaxID=35708 RepID=A0A0A8Z119_ARUDO
MIGWLIVLYVKLIQVANSGTALCATVGCTLSTLTYVPISVSIYSARRTECVFVHQSPSWM